MNSNFKKNTISHFNGYLKEISLYLLIILSITPSSLISENISILYFKNHTGRSELEWISKGITDMLIGDLSQVEDLNLVEREDLNKILKEQSLSQSGLTEGKEIEIGRLLSADYLIIGSYAVSGNKIRIDSRITDTMSGKVLHSVKTEGNMVSFLDLEKILAGSIIDKLGKKRPPGLEKKETDSLKAAEYYYQGLDLLDSGNADQALVEFNRASDTDPDYAKPVEAAEKSYQFLKDFRKQRQQREIKKLYQMIRAYQKKLNTEPWMNYAQWLKKNSALSQKQSRTFLDSPDGKALMHCDVPARCVWHLMMTRIDAGGKYEEYFNNNKKKEALLRENLKDAEKARKAFSSDPVLSEVMYMEIFSLKQLGEKKAIRIKAREFLETYPDYRLVEFVEDWYEESLKED
ncbi:MAG: CsgG/HfaB family protein [Spirochaetia bacterium]|nr:CsgG/HfaB family protein [Spirochaetia bacterium]